jgi:acyl carrier protein
VVIARELSPGDLGLVAYVVPSDGQSVDIAALRSFIKGKLPAYMLPSAFEVLEKIPLNANRKVDRKALPVPKKKSADLVQDFVAPRTASEERVAKVWSEVLQFEPIGIHDNFFQLGGHSLMAIQVISRVRDQMQVELPLRTLFENPTVSELCVAIESYSNDGKAKDFPIIPVKRERIKRASS